MNVGQAAKISGLPAKTIRYYEDISLVSPLRQDNGYRFFRESDIHKLTFLQRARGLGFSIEQCRSLLSLYEDDNRASADVKKLAQQKIVDIEAKIAELKTLKSTLTHLVKACHGNDLPDCPILDSLAGQLPV